MGGGVVFTAILSIIVADFVKVCDGHRSHNFAEKFLYENENGRNLCRCKVREIKE